MRTQPTTVRLTDDDQSYLAALKIPGASSLSDKIRALIADRRLEERAGRDYQAALATSDRLINPLRDAVRLAENRHRVHSALVQRSLDWLTELTAVLLSEQPAPAEGADAEGLDKKDLYALEDALAERLCRLVDVLAQSALARETACYRAEALLDARLLPLQRLARLALEQKTLEQKK